MKQSPIARHFHKAPAIYKSQHEPFLSGNIAMRDVIGMISRKAISSLASVSIANHYTGVLHTPFFSPFDYSPHVQPPAFRRQQTGSPSNTPPEPITPDPAAHAAQQACNDPSFRISHPESTDRQK